MHKKGIQHRDIKQDNILLDENLTPKLCDFGVNFFYKKLKGIEVYWA